jgi:hypothetical membrane protein
MSSLVIGGTVAVIILMWVLMRPDDFKIVSKAISDLYTGSVGALIPKAGS